VKRIDNDAIHETLLKTKPKLAYSESNDYAAWKAAVKAKSGEIYAEMIKQFGKLEMLYCEEPQGKSIFER